jgi:hypothetical protein
MKKNLARNNCEERFVGNGNVWVPGGGLRLRGWQIACSRCQVKSKIVTSHGNKSSPPPVIIRRLEQAGWQVANDPSRDLCDTCQATERKKIIQPRLNEAKQALASALTAPIVTNGSGRAVHYSEIETLAKLLTPEHKKQLIATLQETIPRRKYSTRKMRAIESLPESNDEYEVWLNTINDGDHK